MLKPFFVLPALLLFAPAPQQPTAPATAPAAAPAAPAAPAAAPAAAVAASIPPKAAHMINPVKPTAESQAHVKKVYGYDCAMCHGATGNGKGDVVADLKLTLKDYTDPAALKDMTDGELFYVIKNGRGQMPGEGDRAKPDDLWNMVILVRSFSKK